MKITWCVSGKFSTYRNAKTPPMLDNTTMVMRNQRATSLRQHYECQQMTMTASWCMRMHSESPAKALWQYCDACSVYFITFQNILGLLQLRITGTVYPKKYAYGFCFAVLCCGYTLTDFPISIRLTSVALWQSNDCPSASKATLMNMDKYFMWIHYERLLNHNKAKHNKTVCIFLGIYCNCEKCKNITLKMLSDITAESLQYGAIFMMTSSNGNIFRVTGHLCG